MTRFLMNRQGWVLALLAGSMPLGTVVTCNGGPGGGTLFYDSFGDGGHFDDGLVFAGGPRRGHYDEVIIVEDYVYDDVYYDDIYYDDVYYQDVYYDDPYYGGYCDPYSFWGC